MNKTAKANLTAKPTRKENVVETAPRALVSGVGLRTLRLRELPESLAPLTVPSERMVECEPELAEILVAQGYADRVE